MRNRFREMLAVLLVMASPVMQDHFLRIPDATEHSVVIIHPYALALNASRARSAQFVTTLRLARLVVPA